MLSFISIIKCHGITATYHISLSHQNQYSAELIRQSDATDSLPEKLSIDKYKVAQSAADRSDLVISKIASAILLAENNQEGFS